MGGINGVSSSSSVRPTTFTPAVDGMGSSARPPRRSPVGDSLDLSSMIRIGTPAYKVGLEEFGGQAQGFLGRIFGGGASGGTMTPGWGSFGSGLERAGDVVGGASGGVMGGLGGIGGALKNALGMFVGALKSNFLVSAVVSGATNVLDVVTGKETPKQAIATFAVDTAAYTGIGATSTVIGAALGSLIPIPFVGTLLGIAAGMGLGYLYEKTVRHGLIHSASSFLG